MGLYAALKKLPKDQKQGIFLLQTGTFLEFFDLLLFIHMAVILEEIFFEKSSPLLSAFGFVAVFVFRPLGALLFGWIGDNMGRKKTIIITTSMMCLSCILMANVPTYAQIGITASWIVTICRIMQGMSSMGEVTAAEIYVLETIPRPLSYSVVTFISVASAVGGSCALGMVTCINYFGFDWRYVFWFGALIGVTSAFARRTLKETPDFIKMRNKKIREEIKSLNSKDDPVYGKILSNSWKEPINYKTLWAFFSITCANPVKFYIVFIFFNPLLKSKFNYSAEDIISHNLYLSLLLVIDSIVCSVLTYKIHPLKITKFRVSGALLIFFLMPIILYYIDNPIQLFIMQGSLIFLSLEEIPGQAVFLRHFPLYKRFTFASFIFSIGKALMYTILTFGLVYLCDWFGYYGIWILSLPIITLMLFALNHYKELEIKQKSYPCLGS